MAAFTGKIFSTFTSAYRSINSSTLNGAIDIIVVQQEDGTLRCTPFHVRFGKLGVLSSQKTRVYITINDRRVDDVYMQLGDAGEAAFGEEDITNTVLPPIRHLEPSNGNLFLDPDGVLTPPKDPSKPKQLSNIDCSPQIVNKQLDAQKDSSSDQTYSYEKPNKTPIDVDVLQSNTQASSVSRRRIKRRMLNRYGQDQKTMSEDEDYDLYHRYSFLKRRLRTRKRDATSMGSHHRKTGSVVEPQQLEKLQATITLLRKRSASETDLFLCPMNNDGTTFANGQNGFHSIDSRPKTLLFHLNEENSKPNGQTNPINIESADSTIILDDSDALREAVLSKSAPSNATNPTAIRGTNAADDSNGDFFSNGDFSPNSSYESALSPRPTSPKSDTEYELGKEPPQDNVVEWKWGKFPDIPEQRTSVFGRLWSSSKKSTPKEGVYLDEITNNGNVDRSLYLPQLTYQQNQLRSTNDDDQESGTGYSIPQSPFRENETSFMFGDAQLSLCGHSSKQPSITDEMFNAHLVTFETFINNPSIVQDPNLIVRVGGKYYNWSVASVLMTSTCIFHKPLPFGILDQLQEKHLASTKPRSAATGGSWWPFYGKKSEIKTENVKVPTPSEVLATTMKSQIVSTNVAQRQQIPKKSSKTDNESEQEDSEVRKLTAKIQQEEKEKEQTRLSTINHQTPILRKRMILSSDELKRLNLKLGQNKVEFSVTNAWQGTTKIVSHIFLFDHKTKFVISDIDGTITKSDVLGHIIPLVGGDWSHDGIAEFYNAVQENGYQFIYLSARAIGQSQITRNYLSNVIQCEHRLPSGPLLVSPDTLFSAFYREVIAKKPEDFKIACLKNISSLFPDTNPFYAGFGNRINDQWAYTAVGIPVSRIYTINPQGEVFRQKLSQALSTSYRNLHEIVDLLFPPMDSFSSGETYSLYTYWRDEPPVDQFEEEMRAELAEIAQRQKATKSNAKKKSINGISSVTTTPTTAVLPKQHRRQL